MAKRRRHQIRRATIRALQGRVGLPCRKFLQFTEGESGCSIMRRQKPRIAQGHGHNRNRFLGTALEVEELNPPISIARSQFAGAIRSAVVSQTLKRGVLGVNCSVQAQSFSPLANPFADHSLFLAVIVVRREMPGQVGAPVFDFRHCEHASFPLARDAPSTKPRGLLDSTLLAATSAILAESFLFLEMFSV